MARIAGIDIPREKRVEVALTYVYGIGLPTSQKILAQANVNPDTRVRDLTEEQVNRLREIIDSSGAHAQVEQVIGQLGDLALAALDRARIDDRARAVLRDLAAAATQRIV